MKGKSKQVYTFGGSKTEGRGDMRALLGGKGAGLAEMARIGLPVPPGYTITTEVCNAYDAAGRKIPPGVRESAGKALRHIERAMGRRFGDANKPLLLSVRSGAAISMPGMMDTILNVGLNDATVEALAAWSDDARFAWDSYRRFVQMYGAVVLGAPEDAFEHEIAEAKKKRGVRDDTELGADDWRRLVARFRAAVRKHAKADVPEDPAAQLWGATEAVFRSWNTPRARAYRKINGIPETLGTAVNVQAMVFGNLGEDSGTGVAFTRDPSTGENRFYGEWLPNAQGEDVVAGIRTPRPLAGKDAGSLQRAMPVIHEELEAVRRRLEDHFHDMQDLEFTIERGKLWILQTRTGKRTGRAAVRVAVELAREGKLDVPGAVAHVGPGQLQELFFPTIDPKRAPEPAAQGLAASPGAFSGEVVLTADHAAAQAAAGKRVILVRTETSPDDVHGMHAAQGVLTARGGMTSHAAVVARGMGKACVTGCEALEVHRPEGFIRLGGHEVREGQIITVDGGTGKVYVGDVPTVPPKQDRFYDAFMEMVEKVRKLGVRANADTPEDARRARKLGAEGIGLCRTEHMFFEPRRLLAVREVIFAADRPAREKALKKILPMQRQDFLGILKAMEGLPVTIRLLDPPLHEFLPKGEQEIAGLAEYLKITPADVRARVERLAETNPMLGHRGCRLGVTVPEIYEAQVRAIVEAACRLANKGLDVRPEIMVPLVGYASELAYLREPIDRVIADVQKRAGTKLHIPVGTMIELPRAALRAAEIAKHADFFSFGTNDLTQTTLGLSRDDALFLPTYIALGIMPHDPFTSVDTDGVGELIRLAVERGRAANPKLKVGICGEHGGDPRSIAFCREVGLDYVSCSPFRVPVARFAAARAEATEGNEGD